jgi:hypothetical protein
MPRKSVFKALTLGLIVTLMISGPNVASPKAYAEGEGPGKPAASYTIAATLGEGFTYQGMLQNNGVPANGVYDLRFDLFSQLSGGTSVLGNTSADYVFVYSQTVTNGKFSAFLDFSPFSGKALFWGDERYLEIAVRPTGTPTYSVLTPRQRLTAAPYALSLKPGAVLSSSVAGPMLTIHNADPNTQARGLAIKVANPNTEASAVRIETNSSAATASGLFALSTAVTGTGAVVYGLTSSSEGAAIRGEAATGWAMQASGHVSQVSGYGWMRAAYLFNSPGTVASCFNSLLAPPQAATAPCNAVITNTSGLYTITVPGMNFNAHFIALTLQGPPAVATIIAAGSNNLTVQITSLSSVLTNRPFYLIVY